MTSKSILAVVLTLALASTAMAAGSRSSSSPPTSSQAQTKTYDLGVKAVKAADYERALTLFQKVVGKEPRNADAWNYVGFSHRKLKQFRPSLEAYQKALAINPKHRGANEYLGELYLQTGDLEKARERLKKLDEVCFFGCKEYDDLKQAIKAYESGQKSG